jgi:hypothetical protein
MGVKSDLKKVFTSVHFAFIIAMVLMCGLGLWVWDNRAAIIKWFKERAQLDIDADEAEPLKPDTGINPLWNDMQKEAADNWIRYFGDLITVRPEYGMNGIDYINQLV